MVFLFLAPSITKIISFIPFLSFRASHADLETEKMRFELEEYLREFKEKKDENGIPLVHFPSNFDSIVDAMNRKDLNSNEHK
jgi:cephalosporin-C deacetylase-like acetyl esterase